MTTPNASSSGTFEVGDLTIHRLGFGAMRITGSGIWGEPSDPDTCRKVLRRAVELGVDFIDTATLMAPKSASASSERPLRRTSRAWSSPPKQASLVRVRM